MVSEKICFQKLDRLLQLFLVMGIYVVYIYAVCKQEISKVET